MPKILIVDDEPNIVTLISRYAQREGYNIVTASDGKEAIDKCQSEDFDVIIMDVMMPDTDGFTACKKTKEFKDVPVIMLSARGTEFDKLFGFEVGVDDYVTKPFSPISSRGVFFCLPPTAFCLAGTYSPSSCSSCILPSNVFCSL